MTRARTLARPLTCSGVGLFSSLPSTLTVAPRPAGHGVCFRRTDQPEQPLIPALVNHVFARPRQTVLSPEAGSARPAVHTVEHLLSALAAFGVTDCLCELDGPEVPMMDGSALPFVEAIGASGVVPARPPDRGPAPLLVPLVAERPITVSLDGGMIQALPPDGPWLDVEYYLDYGPGAPIAAQSARWRLDAAEPDPARYAREIAPARTFCTKAEADAMRAAGLFGHLQPRDVLVIDQDGPVDTRYRLEHEPARHKVLDVIGDLSLAGRPIHARVIATRSGHALNHSLVRALLEQA
ncbi:MAG: UDP-3-O-acyl-N-acetylglucosamine deacetylase [Phycisphaerae bacterium]|nr:UDP-3-O-acyl-N-acetylglucosamine deacetylase [Phycisphaerae bacterium]